LVLKSNFPITQARRSSARVFFIASSQLLAPEGLYFAESKFGCALLKTVFLSSLLLESPFDYTPVQAAEWKFVLANVNKVSIAATNGR
jgi:hypothetical protein|tara:strand:+ start:2913 stop:3176 length:264 start_codon:yes stop_codon:yes gene_type:complete